MECRPSAHDVTWFLDLEERNGLDLDPSYQRRSVWSLSDKRFFIDTVLNNYPAPPVYLHQTLDKQGRATYHVVDGKQRLQTIIEFANNKVQIPDDFGNISLQGKCFEQLETNQKREFWNYLIRVEMVPDVNEANLRSIFERIIRNSRKLTRQEMRHAKFDGWFINLVEDEAGTNEWTEFGLVTTARSRRMAEVQFVSELVAIVMRNEVSGLNQDDLDELYAYHDEATDDSEVMADNLKKKMARLKCIVSELLRLEPKIKNYLKLQVHLYTLWAYLYMNAKRLMSAETFAPQYLKFMEKVDSVTKTNSSVAPSTAKENQDFYFVAATKYAQYWVEAKSSDAHPRKMRLEALEAAIHGHEDSAHENC